MDSYANENQDGFRPGPQPKSSITLVYESRQRDFTCKPGRRFVHRGNLPRPDFIASLSPVRMCGLPGCFALWLSSESQFGSGWGADIGWSNQSSGSKFRSSKKVELYVCIPSTHNPNLRWILHRKNVWLKKFQPTFNIVRRAVGVNNNWSWISEWNFYPLMQ